ncbi:MAG: sugar phosphate isomerase/epimerase [Fibrobacteria bacterium]|nr:sugar phosphate isomerase/epimerase [Fibrobacteria bacterium]
MQLLMFRSMWGVLGPWGKFPAENWEQAFPAIKESGYTGIEFDLPKADQHKRFRKLLDIYNFQYIAMIFTSGNTVADHISSFEQEVKLAKKLSPRFIVSHSGQDSFSPEEAKEFFEAALEIEEKEKIPVAHETHRGRILFNPWSTYQLLSQYSELKLCVDLSHWVCVAERLLEDCNDILEMTAQHCLHIHARIGYEQGPQIPDPRMPEAAPYLAFHEKWWQRIWDIQENAGFPETTMDPEFGPPGYMHTLPGTNAPVADLWDICNWQAGRQKTLFASRTQKNS